MTPKDLKSEEEDPGLVDLVCVRCGHVNLETESRCGACKAPLDDFAASSPWEMGTATSAAYPPAANPRTKPIVFWGVWLYFGPSAIVGFWMAVSFFTEFGLVFPSAGPSVPAILIAGFGLLYGLASVWVLWTVTRGYLGKREGPKTPHG